MSENHKYWWHWIHNINEQILSSVNQKYWDHNGQNDLHYQIGNCQFYNCLLGNRFGIQVQVQQEVEKQNKTEAKY